jgi:YesN/AraC family two-component response regulator
MFQEGDHSTGGVLKGTGIGLALSRELVNLHGGTINAANNEDGGLTMTIQLKLGANHYKPEVVSFVDSLAAPVTAEKSIEHPQPMYVTAPGDLQLPLVLLVEDNDELRSFLSTQLGEFYRVETAIHGAAGFEKALQLLPDLIVSDIMMPVMDGIQMLDKLKNDVNTSHIPVVLLSARYSIESQIEGLKYGADYYITKPFDNEFLIASINNLLRQRKKVFESLVARKRSIDLEPEPIVVTSKDEIFLKDVIRVVENKMADAGFNIDAVAGSMAMSRTTFYKKFKSLTGLTPVEFVRDMRLQRAKQYLDGGNHNVSEVAYLVGFSNPKYFSTCFKEKYHVSPSEYQKAKL